MRKQKPLWLLGENNQNDVFGSRHFKKLEASRNEEKTLRVVFATELNLTKFRWGIFSRTCCEFESSCA